MSAASLRAASIRSRCSSGRAMRKPGGEPEVQQAIEFAKKEPGFRRQGEFRNGNPIGEPAALRGAGIELY